MKKYPANVFLIFKFLDGFGSFHMKTSNLSHPEWLLSQVMIFFLCYVLCVPKKICMIISAQNSYLCNHIQKEQLTVLISFEKWPFIRQKYKQYIFLCKYKSKMYLLLVWNFFKGSTIAKNRSADKAVRVKTDTPMETSLAVSDILQIVIPHGQVSIV